MALTLRLLLPWRMTPASFGPPWRRAWIMGELPADQQQRLIEALGDLANAEKDPARAEQLRSFPFACGLVDDDPSANDVEER